MPKLEGRATRQTLKYFTAITRNMWEVLGILKEKDRAIEHFQILCLLSINILRITNTRAEVVHTS